MGSYIGDIRHVHGTSCSQGHLALLLSMFSLNTTSIRLDTWLQDDVASCFEFYADLADKLDTRQGEALQLPMEEFKGAIRREPMGVVALITPWNYPLLMAAVSFARGISHNLAGDSNTRESK